MEQNNNILTASDGKALLRKADGWYMPHGVELKPLESADGYIEVPMDEVDFDKEPGSVNAARNAKLQELNIYDTTEAVRHFEYGGKTLWADKNTRDTIRASIEACSALGDSECTFSIGTELITMRCSAALEMMRRLQRYGMQCNAAKMRACEEIIAMRRVSTIKGYDYTQYYPEVVKI